jgi:hypothetical protein
MTLEAFSRTDHAGQTGRRTQVVKPLHITQQQGG